MGADQGRECGREGKRLRAGELYGRVPGHPVADARDHEVRIGKSPWKG
uniref:Uncharacterized protein n=1 Tax=Arundo donax TaxID=35708 RepID=A0A0A9ALA9_ARUDO